MSSDSLPRIVGRSTTPVVSNRWLVLLSPFAVIAGSGSVKGRSGMTTHRIRYASTPAPPKARSTKASRIQTGSRLK